VSRSATSARKAPARRTSQAQRDVAHAIEFVAAALVLVAVWFALSSLKVGTVDAADVADDASMLVTSGAATCADDLLARVGSTVDCSVVGATAPYFVVRATVTSVDGENVEYEFRRVD